MHTLFLLLQWRDLLICYIVFRPNFRRTARTDAQPPADSPKTCPRLTPIWRLKYSPLAIATPGPNCQTLRCIAALPSNRCHDIPLSADSMKAKVAIENFRKSSNTLKRWGRLVRPHTGTSVDPTYMPLPLLDDVLIHILSLCDIATVLSVSLVCFYFWGRSLETITYSYAH